MLEKLGDALKKATNKLAGAIFVDKKVIEEVTKELQRALISADVNVFLVKEITDKIKKEASDIHGIKNEDLLDKPKFQQLAKSLFEFMSDCYLAGYNNNYFDNSMLQEEFLRCGIEFPNYDIVSIDVCAIFKNFEKRDLSSALKFYCGKELENAHDANADNTATLEVFFAQLEKYDELKGKTLNEISKIGKNEDWVDFQGRIVRDSEGDFCWNFGKAKGKKIKFEMGFGDWVLTNNFPQSFKNMVSKILKDCRKN